MTVRHLKTFARHEPVSILHGNFRWSGENARGRYPVLSVEPKVGFPHGSPWGRRRTIEHEQNTSRIRLEYLDADPSDRSVAADVLFREEPDEEEDEDNEKDDDETDEEEDGDDEGYSE